MQRPGNLNGGASWFGEFSGRGRGKGRGKRRAGMLRGRKHGMHKGMRKGMRKLIPGAAPKCGWFCRMRRRWKGLPPTPPAPVIVEKVEATTAEDIVADTTGVDPTVNGYFGDWTYF